MAEQRQSAAVGSTAITLAHGPAGLSRNLARQRLGPLFFNRFGICRSSDRLQEQALRRLLRLSLHADFLDPVFCILDSSSVPGRNFREISWVVSAGRLDPYQLLKTLVLKIFKSLVQEQALNLLLFCLRTQTDATLRHV
jgi:hypothetical protein